MPDLKLLFPVAATTNGVLVLMHTRQRCLYLYDTRKGEMKKFETRSAVDNFILHVRKKSLEIVTSAILNIVTCLQFFDIQLSYKTYCSYFAFSYFINFLVLIFTRFLLYHSCQLLLNQLIYHPF